MPVRTNLKLEKKFALNFSLLSDGLYYRNVAIAVSGGVDSVALLLLMRKFALENNINLTIFTVNHNLRAEAECDAKFVAELCNKLQVKCIILSWDHQNNLSNLSARARAGRYNLITDHCRKLDILTLLTAHHLDDSIETFLLKKERKSGVMALSAGNLYFHNNIRILRPLFNIHKSDLITYVKEQGVSWTEDITNLTDKYLRNIIRKKVASENPEYRNKLEGKLEEVNLETITLSSELIEATATVAKIYKYGFANLDISMLLSFSYEIQLRLISFIFNVVSGNIKICRASSIAPVISALGNNQVLNKTMHNCVIKKIGAKLIIYREFGKKLPKDVLIDGKTIWDSRFCIEIKDDCSGYHISNLKPKDYLEIKDGLDLDILKKISLGHHKPILFTLPVIKVLEKVVAIPHISYYVSSGLENNVEYLYQPRFTSRFIHFY